MNNHHRNQYKHTQIINTQQKQIQTHTHTYQVGVQREGTRLVLHGLAHLAHLLIRGGSELVDQREIAIVRARQAHLLGHVQGAQEAVACLLVHFLSMWRKRKRKRRRKKKEEEEEEEEEEER